MSDTTEPASLRILIVDDEASIRTSLGRFLGRLGHEVAEAESAEAALRVLRGDDIDLLLLDLRLPGQDGLAFFRELRESHPHLGIIIVSGHGTLDTAIEAMRLGALDFLKKPAELLELEAAIGRSGRLLRAQAEGRRLRGALRAIQRGNEPGAAAEGFVGTSAATEHARRELARAAASPCDTLLLGGPTGTGKEVAARLFHALRHGPDSPFIAVNCPALPEALVESELFGHVRGAFTGATEERLGAFELAHGGTLFLDEIADLAPAAQAKLLRVLETRLVRRIGGHRERAVEVAVVAASNRPLEECVADGTLRQDLLYRLNAVEIRLLPLRERPEDILPLAEHFAAAAARRAGRDAPELTVAAQNHLRDYSFPGNVRELRNLVERAVLFRSGPEPRAIDADDLALPSVRADGHIPGDAAAPAPEISPEPEPLTRQAREAETEAREALDTLAETGWNRRETARRLGITYEALRWRIRKYGLRPARAGSA
jgi:DNA-binding NtrC family response regulator